MRRWYVRFGADSSAAAAVEFALIAPIFFALAVGAMQLGFAMRDYNSLRGAGGDIARYAVVNYKLTDAQLTNYARSVAIRQPYALDNARLGATVVTADEQRVAGAIEKTITLTYTFQTDFGIEQLSHIRLQFSRPVYLVSGK